jgi:hypothetical protein
MFYDTNIPYDRYVPLNEANLTLLGWLAVFLAKVLSLAHFSLDTLESLMGL